MDQFFIEPDDLLKRLVLPCVTLIHPLAGNATTFAGLRPETVWAVR